MADEGENTSGSEKIPTHLLVQRQMQDLIAFQKARVSKLEQDVTLQNTTMRDSFVSREQHFTELNRLQESLRNDFVPKDQYDLAVSQLEEEKVQHAQTRAELHDTSEQLETAMRRIEALNKQVQVEKAAYEKAFGSVRSKTKQETNKTEKLQNKCSEIAKHCEQQEQILNAKTTEIQNLELKLKIQGELYQKELTEAEIEKRQQRYIAKMIEEQDRKKVRGNPQAVPKSKLNRR